MKQYFKILPHMDLQHSTSTWTLHQPGDILHRQLAEHELAQPALHQISTTARRVVRFIEAL